MRAYMVKATGITRLAATGGEARAFRQAMVEERGLKKKDVEISPVELKTAKPNLLAFMNGLLEEVDDKEDFEMPEGLEVVDKEAKKAAREAKKAEKAKPTKQDREVKPKAAPPKKAAPKAKPAPAKAKAKPKKKGR